MYIKYKDEWLVYKISTLRVVHIQRMKENQSSCKTNIKRTNEEVEMKGKQKIKN